MSRLEGARVLELERVDLSACTPLVPRVASTHIASERRENRQEHNLEPTCTGSTGYVAYTDDEVERGQNSAIVVDDRGILGRRRD